MITRTDVRSVACAACVVPAGCPCLTGQGRARTGCHAERWAAYRASLPVLLPTHLRPVIHKHRLGWACTTQRDFRRYRTTYVSGSPMGAYLKWFMARNMNAKRQVVAAHPRVAQHLDESLRRYLEMTR